MGLLTLPGRTRRRSFLRGVLFRLAAVVLGLLGGIALVAMYAIGSAVTGGHALPTVPAMPRVEADRLAVPPPMEVAPDHGDDHAADGPRARAGYTPGSH